jgi:ubiquinone/menaquinone biosynthesis C-methylase UbiE
MYDMYRMFVHPDGRPGEAGARLMARTGPPMARRAAALLAIDDPAARILEIGFGPGIGIATLAETVPRGHVTGVDPSRVMHRHAERRNAKAIRDGRVTLVEAGAEDLPFPADSFDAAMMIDNLHFWPDPLAGLTELRRVLRSAARVVCAFTPPSGGPPHGIENLFGSAGYAEIATHRSGPGFLLSAITSDVT